MRPSSPRLLGVRLADGITKTNMWACLSLALTSTAVAAFLPAAQPYILGATMDVPAAQHGRIVGILGVAAEIAMIVSLAWYGAMADRFGRRPVVLAGFTLCALGIVLFPFAGNIGVLIALRVVFASGSAALSAMLATIAIDYVRERSRGRSYGLIGFLAGLGAVIAVLGLLQVPNAIESMVGDPVVAARLAFLFVAVATMAAAGLLWMSLSRARVSATGLHTPLPRLVREGLALARDPGVALAYAAGFVARADLAVIGTFMTLWIKDYGSGVAGMSDAQATARAGMVVGIAMTVAMLFAPLWGWLGDRMKRQDAAILAQFLSGGLYLTTLLISDPLGSGMLIVAVLVGFAQVGGIVTIGPLLGQQTPADVRGTAFGLQVLCGAAGILTVSALGGLLYDLWLPAAPFVVSGALSLIVVAFGLAVRRRVAPNPETETATRAVSP